MKVLLAEKPSVARELAAFVGARDRQDGYFEGQGYQVTWALGHLATLKEPEDYDPALKRWSLATLPIVPDKFELKLIDAKGGRQQFNVIKKLFRAADEIVCATDAGREGELIFRYILELAGATRKPAQRLWLSSLTESAIRDAFKRLRPLSDYDTLYAAARCRSQSDWIVGLNATRYYTVRHRSAGGLLWSVGRVQTPVLALIVRRDDEIRAFKPEPFWELMTKYRKVVFKFAGERFLKEELANEWLARVLGHPFVVRSVERKEERDLPPQLYDLTELQRDMNRRYGMSADATLKAAQSLYEAKVLTYPRTDSRYLTHDMKGQIPGIFDDLRSYKPDEIAKLDLDRLSFTSRIFNDAKVKDHHAIIPTGKSALSQSPALLKVYEAVVTRFIAAFYPACVKEVTSVAGESNGVPFKARGVRILVPGWTVLYPTRDDDKKSDEQQELPEFKPGETGPHEPFIKKGETTPPKSYTEGTLLGAMETAGKLVDDETLKEALKEKGLGTPATRAAIIETLLTRGYILRDKKTLLATEAGRYLIALVRDRGLKSPELTGEWEAKLREIEHGRLDAGQFMDEIIRYTEGIIRSAESATVDESKLGDCPRCGRPVIEGNRGYGCSGWREGCPFVLWKEHKGVTLDVGQIRELLQHRVLLRPIKIEGVGDVVLQLADSGAVLEIRVPQVPEKGKDGEAKPKRAVRAKGPRAPRRKAAATSDESSGEEGPLEEGTVRRKTAAKKGGAIGVCPLCGKEVVEQEKSFGCSGWRDGCKFTIWKTIAGKKLSARTAQTLLKQGATPLIKGFRSKAGKPFDAKLKLQDGAVRFDFDA
jgi:DNA topoisomerase-3